MVDKHIIHLPEGGRVIIEGDRVEIHLAGPIVVQRKRWIRYFIPEEEVRRTLLACDVMRDIEKALVSAFSTAPMTVYPESGD